MVRDLPAVNLRGFLIEPTHSGAGDGNRAHRALTRTSRFAALPVWWPELGCRRAGLPTFFFTSSRVYPFYRVSIATNAGKKVWFFGRE